MSRHKLTKKLSSHGFSSDANFADVSGSGTKLFLIDLGKALKKNWIFSAQIPGINHSKAYSCRWGIEASCNCKVTPSGYFVGAKTYRKGIFRSPTSQKSGYSSLEGGLSVEGVISLSSRKRKSP